MGGRCGPEGEGTPVDRSVAASVDSGAGEGPGALTLKLIDGFELSCDSDNVPLPMAAQRLVAFLALRNRPLLRVFVAGSLWLDTDEERSCANLRRTLWRIRRPGHAIVEASATHVALHRAVFVDVHELVRQARRVLAAENDHGIVPLNIPAPFDGDLLPDWYDQWLEPEREWLRQLRLHASERAAELALIQGRAAHAIDIALNALRTEPLRESLHALVIQAHLAQGNRGSAIHHYDVYAARIAARLGLSPSPEIHRLLKDSLSTDGGVSARFGSDGQSDCNNLRRPDRVPYRAMT